jgi:uncharacterized membrane protein YraQ (UPF0718 family)
VAAFIFADLIILPILNIYRKYYGRRMALFLLATFYTAMAAAGYIVEFLLGGLGLIPNQNTAKLPTDHVTWNYTTFLNIAFLILAAALVIRFVRTGGAAMLRMMGGAPDQMDHGAMEHGAMEHGSEHHAAQADPADTSGAGHEGTSHRHDDQGHHGHGHGH